MATKHDKLPLIAPAVLGAVGLCCQDAAVDTDLLGTFSGSVRRTASPLATAAAKARLGMAARGSRLGLASEGTIGPHPGIPLVPLDVELVVLVDDERDIVVVGTASSTDIRAASTTLRPGDSTEPFLARSGFPSHRLLVRPEGVPPAGDTLTLGIDSREALAGAIAAAAGRSPTGAARVENDHRAHCSPSRRAVIAASAADLALRLATACPRCGSPGFGRTGFRYGLPCGWCGRLAEGAVRAEVHGCPACDHTLERARPEAFVDPGRCPRCNP